MAGGWNGDHNTCNRVTASLNPVDPYSIDNEILISSYYCSHTIGEVSFYMEYQVPCGSYNTSSTYHNIMIIFIKLWLFLHWEYHHFVLTKYDGRDLNTTVLTKKENSNNNTHIYMMLPASTNNHQPGWFNTIQCQFPPATFIETQISPTVVPSSAIVLSANTFIFFCLWHCITQNFLTNPLVNMINSNTNHLSCIEATWKEVYQWRPPWSATITSTTSTWFFFCHGVSLYGHTHPQAAMVIKICRKCMLIYLYQCLYPWFLIFSATLSPNLLNDIGGGITVLFLRFLPIQCWLSLCMALVIMYANFWHIPTK